MIWQVAGSANYLIFIFNQKLMLRVRSLLYPVFLLLLLSCNNHDNNKLFKKLSPANTNIRFTNQLDYNDSVSVLEFEYMFNGGGVALIDINNDSLQDIIFTGNMVSNRIYLNKGNMEFEDITEKAGVASDGWSNGVAVVDINQDGFQDFYVCKAGNYRTPPDKMRNLFYINNGNSTFTESAKKMGLDDNGYDINAAFFDYDKDGDLDMYLLRNAIAKSNRNISRPKDESGEAESTDKLFRNNGDLTFTDVSKEAGITIEGFGLGVTVNDINNDGWPDVYVSNDFLSNDLMWINNKNGTFTNRAKECLRHETYNGMGNDVADYNNDGLPDIMVVDMLPPDNKRWKLTMKGNNYDEFEQNMADGYEAQYVRNTLQLNNGDGTFSEIGMLAGVHATEWSWAPLFVDLDNDGWKDLYITNGFRQDINNLDFVNYGFNVYGKKLSASGSPAEVRRERLELLNKLPSIKVHNYLYKNERNLQFKDVSVEWGMSDEGFSNGTAYGDLDNDGDLDLVINKLDGPSAIYENQTSQLHPDKGWLRVNLKGSAGNSGAFGTKLWIWQDGKMQYQYCSPYRGYLSTNEQTLHFGIENDQVDSLKVLWPDGNVQIMHAIKPKQVLTLDYKNGINNNTDSIISTKNNPLFTAVSKAVTYKHSEDYFVDFKVQQLLPHMHSRLGPGIAVGDVNGDGRDDIFVGAASGNAGNIFIQHRVNTFVAKQFHNLNFTDDMGALIFDADNDGDNDLYVASGGSSMARKESELYKHKLYINDGHGNFTLLNEGWHPVITAASGVKAADYDRDGDLDLFVCGRISPGQYPISPKSFLLRNDSKNKQCRFTDVTTPALEEAGMLSDALWTDFDNDGWVDIIAVGEFMPVKFFKNEKGTFKEVTSTTGLTGTNGWWNSIASGDFDNDGDIDYVVGNLGLNGPYKASVKEPVCVYATDYDQNGKLDPIMCHFIDGKEYMVHSRNDIIKQMTSMRGRFRSYDSYANVTMQQAMRKEELSNAFVVKAERFESSYVENLGGGKFKMSALPLEAQFSPIYGMLTGDFDHDGHLDVLAVGNSYATEVQTGRYDAQGSLLLKGDGKGNFITARDVLNIFGDNKSIAQLQMSDGSSSFVVGVNSDSLKMFKINNYPDQVSLQPDDAYALMTGPDNKTRRQEFYYGQSYISQSARRFSVPADAKSVVIYSFRGDKRVIK
jgi:enediyne biosynthesis protein E4